MSSETTTVRTSILRGGAPTAVRAALDSDLTLSRHAPSLVDPAAAAAQAEQAVRQSREEAARAGYEDGYAAGMRAGADAATQQTAAAQAALNTALEALAAAGDQFATRQAAAVADIERHVTNMALQIAEAVVGREVATSPTAGHDAIVRALRLAPAGPDVVARLNPLDLDTVGDAAPHGDRNLTLVPDESVERGGCVLEVGACHIDAQVGPALARVREVLDQW